MLCSRCRASLESPSVSLRLACPRAEDHLRGASPLLSWVLAVPDGLLRRRAVPLRLVPSSSESLSLEVPSRSFRIRRTSSSLPLSWYRRAFLARCWIREDSSERLAVLPRGFLPARPAAGQFVVSTVVLAVPDGAGVLPSACTSSPPLAALGDGTPPTWSVGGSGGGGGGASCSSPLAGGEGSSWFSSSSVIVSKPSCFANASSVSHTGTGMFVLAGASPALWPRAWSSLVIGVAVTLGSRVGSSPFTSFRLALTSASNA
mmetsp:Transcript_23576/g.66154  ORF Transcript_23576/g.66154 Transcript_23576/m.66154 type:complete len:260 (+) Transcript_23576:202-981(+)